MNLEEFWRDILRQDEIAIKDYFHENAYVNWHCTNEHFTVQEFIRANCEYPGAWDGEMEEKYQLGDLYITVMRVFAKDGPASFHVTSFIKTSAGKIVAMDEYWGDDGPAPQWRLDKHIGTVIK